MSEYERKPIPGYPGYEIDTEGQVWSRWKRTCPGYHRGTTHVLGDEYHKVSPLNNRGYQKVSLKSAALGKVVRNRLVHHLVLEAFVGPRPEGMECRHLDGNRANNNLTNLQWGTKTENGADKVRHGMSPVGEKHSKAKTDEKTVLRMRQLQRDGMKPIPIAAAVNLPITLVRDVLSMRTWTHLKEIGNGV